METEPAAVALCDPRMAGRDGLWLTEQLRERYLDTAVIISTRAQEVGYAASSLRAGVDAYDSMTHIRPYRDAAVSRTSVRAADGGGSRFTFGRSANAFRRSVKAVAQWCQQHRHDPVENQAAALNAKLRGHYQYYGRPTNFRSLWKFYRLARRLWHKWLNRRTRGKRLHWDSFQQLLNRHPLLHPRICHAWASPGSPA
jgi:ActR/RegA family two-component response regulator